MKKKNNMIRFISDMHLSHANVIKFNNRPFSNAHEMNEKLIENWNSVVKDEDVVYHLGDFSFDSPGYTAEYMKRLKGKIKFIRGNHDNTIHKLFINKIITNPRFEYLHHYHEFAINKERFVLFHYPIENWPGKYRDSIHIHGHSHFIFGNTMKNRFDVSVEGINYTPISLDDILHLKVKGAYPGRTIDTLSPK